VTAMILGGSSTATGQLQSHVIAGVGVEPLFQGTRCQAQSLAPCRALGSSWQGQPALPHSMVRSETDLRRIGLG
jgi:hypothetical protein